MRIKFGRSTLYSVLRRENMFTSFNIKLEVILKKKKKKHLTLFDIDPDLQKGGHSENTLFLDHVKLSADLLYIYDGNNDLLLVSFLL